MMQNYTTHTRGWLSIVITLLLAIMAGNNGCKDNIVATGEQKERTLTVVATVYDPITKTYSLPARDAEISLFQTGAGGESLVATFHVGSDGIGRYKAGWPVAGVQLKVTGMYNNEFRISNPESFKFCSDSIVTLQFEGVPPPDINCTQNIDTLITVRFLNEKLSTDLVKDMPYGLAKHFQTLTLFRNSHPTMNICVEEVSNKMADSPFKIETMLAGSRDVTNERPATVRPLEVFSFKFSVATTQLGHFEKDFVFSVHPCDSGLVCPPKKFRVRLIADVIESPCDCEKITTVFLQPELDPVTVGETRTYTINVVTAATGCSPLYLDSVHVDTPGDWKVTSPANGVFHGNSITATVQFTPLTPGRQTSKFTFYYRLENMKSCSMTVNLRVDACVDANAEIDTAFVTGNAFWQSMCQTDTIHYEPPHLPFTNLQCLNRLYINKIEIPVRYPQNACCPQCEVKIRMLPVHEYPGSTQYFDLASLSRTTIASGNGYPFTVNFTAPTINEFNRLFADGIRTKNTQNPSEDSVFSVVLRLDFYKCGSTQETCTRFIKIHQHVGESGKLSEICNLRAYHQVTDLISIPAAEVYFQQFTSNIFAVVRGLGQGTPLYPGLPNQGDIYVDVENPNVAYPPLPLKEPALFRCPKSGYVKLLRVATGYEENKFLMVKPIVDYLQQQLDMNTNYFRQASLPFDLPLNANSIRPLPGEVYVIFSSEQNSWTGPGDGRLIPCDMFMLYVRSRTVGRGEELMNTHHQSGIEFRTIYPVVLHY